MESVASTPLRRQHVSDHAMPKGLSMLIGSGMWTTSSRAALYLLGLKMAIKLRLYHIVVDGFRTLEAEVNVIAAPAIAAAVVPAGAADVQV